MRKFEGYTHGINFGGWFSQCDNTEERYDTFITDKDFETVKNWGLDHVRIPVDYNLVQNEDGSFKPQGFERIQKCIDWCHKYGLNMILDLHKTIGFSFDKGENEEGFFEKESYQILFYRLWAEFAKQFGKSDNIAFELLNEVTYETYKDAWNRISTEAIRHIRDFAPEVKILVGGYHNNSVEAVKDLAMPYDNNIVYNFHCYNPIIFTHQGAYWIDTMDRNFRMSFDATYAQYRKNTLDVVGEYFIGQLPDSEEKLDEKYFDSLFSEAVKVCEERDVPLYCGEYGVIDLADPADALKWYRCISRIFDKYEIGRAAWTYREMDFGLVGDHYRDVREEIIKLL